MHKSLEMRRLLWLTLAVVVGSSQAGIAYSDTPTVLKIRAGGCTIDPLNRALTGFVVKGQEGILTALHGVADCSEITAESFSPRVTLVARVASQDVGSDAALLVPRDDSEQEKLNQLAAPLKPFELLPPGTTLETGLAVTAYGFEGGVLTTQSNTRLAIGKPATERLGNILGSKNTDEIVARGSPSVDLQVIKLEGTVNKGESGGPVVVPSKSDAVIGLVLGSPEPGLSNLAWVAPLGGINWKPFDSSYWKTKFVPGALADAVGYDGPSITLSLELAHDAQIADQQLRAFPIDFQSATGGADIVHEMPFWAAPGRIFTDPVIEESESVGVVERVVTIADDGRTAQLHLRLRSGSGDPRVAFRGTVRLLQVRDIPQQHITTTVNFSKRPDGTPYGERTIEATTEGSWETFKLLDPSNRMVASGHVGDRVQGRDTDVSVKPDGARVTISFLPSPVVPLPPPTVILR